MQKELPNGIREIWLEYEKDYNRDKEQNKPFSILQHSKLQSNYTNTNLIKSWMTLINYSN